MRDGYFGKYFINYDEKVKAIQQEELEKLQAEMPIEMFKGDMKLKQLDIRRKKLADFFTVRNIILKNF